VLESVFLTAFLWFCSSAICRLSL